MRLNDALRTQFRSNYVIFTFPGADILLRVSSSGKASLEKVCESNHTVD